MISPGLPAITDRAHRGPLALLVMVFQVHPAVLSKEAAMFASLVKRVIAQFHRKRGPESGHEVHETRGEVFSTPLF
jgi:hypothetical protein